MKKLPEHIIMQIYPYEGTVKNLYSGEDVIRIYSDGRFLRILSGSRDWWEYPPVIGGAEC
jgi:hypothetical protein